MRDLRNVLGGLHVLNRWRRNREHRSKPGSRPTVVIEGVDGGRWAITGPPTKPMQFDTTIPRFEHPDEIEPHEPLIQIGELDWHRIENDDGDNTDD
ncbi:hypothetical protein [Nocardia asiatica]